MLYSKPNQEKIIKTPMLLLEASVTPCIKVTTRPHQGIAFEEEFVRSGGKHNNSRSVVQLLHAY